MAIKLATFAIQHLKKKYVLSASAENATVYHLGGRDLDSFAEAGVLPEFAGVAVHDPLQQLLPSPLGKHDGPSGLHGSLVARLHRRR
jgi:hypothetical protein